MCLRKVWHNALNLSLHEYEHCECTVLYNKEALYATDLKACLELLELLQREADNDESDNVKKSKSEKMRSAGRIQKQLLCFPSSQFIKIFILKQTFPNLDSWAVFFFYCTFITQRTASFELTACVSMQISFTAWTSSIKAPLLFSFFF